MSGSPEHWPASWNVQRQTADQRLPCVYKRSSASPASGPFSIDLRNRWRPVINKRADSSSSGWDYHGSGTEWEARQKTLRQQKSLAMVIEIFDNCRSAHTRLSCWISQRQFSVLSRISPHPQALKSTDPPCLLAFLTGFGQLPSWINMGQTPGFLHRRSLHHGLSHRVYRRGNACPSLMSVFCIRKQVTLPACSDSADVERRVPDGPPPHFKDRSADSYREDNHPSTR